MEAIKKAQAAAKGNDKGANSKDQKPESKKTVDKSN